NPPYPNCRMCSWDGDWDCPGMYGLSSFHPGGGNIAFADGSVHFLKSSTANPVVWGLGSRGQGEGLWSDYYCCEFLLAFRKAGDGGTGPPSPVSSTRSSLRLSQDVSEAGLLRASSVPALLELAARNMACSARGSDSGIPLSSLIDASTQARPSPTS